MTAKQKIPIEYIEWETFSGKICVPDCWCRGIRAITKRGRKRIFVDVSFLSKKQAEFIVKIHNEWLCT